MITVQLLGGASLRSGDVPLAGPPTQRHRLALLTLVVATWPQPLSRDRAMALLWPERDTTNARRLLNLAVHVLRTAIGDDAIISAGDGLILDPSRVYCDLHELRTAIQHGDRERIVRCSSGALLDGFHLDSTDFNFWLDDHRNALTHAYVGALLALDERQTRAGDAHARVGTCRRLVAADPHAAAYALALMRALDAAGDRSGAIPHAAEHAHRVRTEIGLEPDAEVVALARTLRETPARRPTTTARPAHARARAVAVLPFLNLSSDPEHAFFADGITEDVIAHLSTMRALTVISRASVTPFKQRPRSFHEIGDRLGVSFVLDGSVRHAGDRVRIVASLVEVESDRSLWTETYDRQLTDIFSIQSDVALRIADALQAELSREERARVRREPTQDVHAYRLFLEARQKFIRFTPESLAQAIALCDRAVARDPTFALAYAHIAMAYTELTEGGALAPDIAYAHATAAAANAVRIDPELGAAHCTTGHLKTVREFDWSGAEAAFKRAIELSPSYADAYDLYGRLCAALERYDDALTLLARAQELDPLAHRVDIVTALIRAERYDEAIARGEQAVELDVNDDRAHATLGWAYFMSGRHDDGIRELEQAVALSSNNMLWLSQLGEAYGLAGKTAYARAMLASLEERARVSYVSPYHFAYVYTGLGEHDRAVEWLEHAVAKRAGPGYGVKGSFLFRALHTHPRFHALLRSMNLE